MTSRRAALPLAVWCSGLIVALCLGACSLVVDAEQARLCRQVIAGIEGGATRIDVLSTRALTRTATPLRGPGDGVEISYRLAAGAGESVQSHTIGCLFDSSKPTQTPADRIVSIEVDGLPLSTSRIYMLKRFWIDTIPGSVDPEPVPGARNVPEIPRTLAIIAQALLAGLPQMALLSLLAASYALVYGLVGRINLAFGDLVSVGGYAALIGITLAGQSVAWAITLAVVLAIWAATAVSTAAGRLVFEPLQALRGQSPLIASAGLAIVLSETVRLAKVGGPKSGRPLLNDPIALIRAEDFVVTVTPVALLVAVGAALGLALLLWGLARTSWGRAWRAASDDALAASLMGVSPSAIHAATFAASGLLAGLGGAIAAISYGSLSYAGGLVVGLKALIAALLGGAGSIRGAILCGFAVGIAEALWSTTLPIEHRDAMLFTVLVLILVLRPGGFFGLPGLERKL